MKQAYALLLLVTVCFFSCKKDDQNQTEEKEEKQQHLNAIGTTMIITKSYLTDTTKALNEDYEKFAGVWRLHKFVCGTCGAFPQNTDTTEILTLRRNGQFERIKSDTVYATGTYAIKFGNRCGYEGFEKTFLFEDVEASEKTKNSVNSFPHDYLASTINISDNSTLTIAAPKCLVDMDGYRTYKKITE